MARRLCFDERVRIEAMSAAGFSAAAVAQRLGRRRATIQRELAGNGGSFAYRAGDAQAAACGRARRSKPPKLVRHAELAEAVAERLEWRWSPQAISADLRAQGLSVCAETIYQACYDRAGKRGLAKNSWRCLPRQRRWRKPRGRCEQGGA